MKTLSSKLVALFGLLWVLLSAWVQLSGDPWLWGLLPSGQWCGWWVWPATVIAALFFLLVLGGKESLLTGHKFVLPGRLTKALVVSGGTFLLWSAWVMRSSNHFMGDGWAHLSNVNRDFFLRPYEPLDFFTHQLLFRLIKFFGLDQAIYAYWIPHLLLLPVYLYVLWRLSRQLTETNSTRNLVFALLASTGALQLFFGYVETYTFLNLLLAAYFLSALKNAGSDHPVSPLCPTLTMLLAAAFHLAALVFVPTLIYLWWGFFSHRKDSRPNGKDAIVIFITFGLAAVLVLIFSGSELILPFAKTADGSYTLFSPPNLWDKFNFLTFVLPWGGIILVLMIVGFQDFLDRLDHRAVLLVIAAACAIGFSFIFNPMLGIRDWDIFTIIALPIAMFSAWLLISITPAVSGRMILAGLVLGSCAHIASLISINSMERRGVDFLIRVAGQERRNTINFAQLGHLLWEHDYEREATKVYELVRGSARMTTDFHLADTYIEMGLGDEAIRTMRKYADDELPRERQAFFMAYMTMSYDLVGNPELASDYYISMLENDLLPRQGLKDFWITTNQAASMRNGYLRDYRKHASTAGELMFLVRYYTLAFNQQLLMEVYSIIASGTYPSDDWERFIRIAKVSKHNIYKILVERASSQHPQLAEKFARIAES